MTGVKYRKRSTVWLRDEPTAMLMGKGKRIETARIAAMRADLPIAAAFRDHSDRARRLPACTEPTPTTTLHYRVVAWAPAAVGGGWSMSRAHWWYVAAGFGVLILSLVWGLTHG